MTPKKKPHAKDPKAPRQERSRATVAFILDATRRVIAEKGVDNLRIHDVAERAGVSVASVYQYFPTREALMAAWEENSFERLLEATISRARSNHEESVPLEVSIFELSLLGLDLFAAHARQFQAEDTRVSRRDERVMMMEAAAQLFGSLLESRAATDRRLAGKDLALCARVAVHAISALGYEVHLRASSPDYDRTVAQMVTSLFLGPPPPPAEDTEEDAPLG